MTTPPEDDVNRKGGSVLAVAGYTAGAERAAEAPLKDMDVSDPSSMRMRSGNRSRDCDASTPSTTAAIVATDPIGRSPDTTTSWPSNSTIPPIRRNSAVSKSRTSRAPRNDPHGPAAPHRAAPHRSPCRDAAVLGTGWRTYNCVFFGKK